MKNHPGIFKKRLKIIGEHNSSGKDKTTGFQIAVTALLTTAILCIAWYLIKILP